MLHIKLVLYNTSILLFYLKFYIILSLEYINFIFKISSPKYIVSHNYAQKKLVLNFKKMDTSMFVYLKALINNS